MSLYDDELIIKLRKLDKTWKEIGEVLDADSEAIRSYARSQDWYSEIRQMNANGSTEEIDKKTYSDDGSVSSTIKQRMKEKKTFTRDELLEIHSLDKNEFQIKNITSNEWSVTNSEGEQYYNFQSKILAEPITQEITPEFIHSLFNDIKPLDIPLNVEEITDSYLLIPFADMHWGINYAKDYEPLKAKVKDRIIESHQEILITLHGDFFNVDNLLNTTVRGTHVDDVDVERATEDAYSFLIDILNCAVEHSPCVQLVYLQGNHDSMVGYMFTQGIKRLFPQVMVDDSLDTYKHSWLGEHSIFTHHGDKIRNSKRLLETIVGTFPKEWGESKSRYLITGHYHHEKSLSNAGMTHYQVSSPSKASSYDKQQGFVTSENYQMLFRFDNEKRDAIYYL